jgi:RND family efflux transporter MFP subunit
MPDDGTDMLHYTPPRRLKLIGIVAACVAAVVVVIGLTIRLFDNRAVASWTDAEAIPTVKVINLAASDGQALVLPGDVQAFNSAPIYARVSGYLKAWYVDIGAPVKAGQLLATIDIPDQDQQLLQAKADLATAQANQHLSAVTAVRWNQLLKLGAVAPQDVDTKNGDLAAKNAAVASARANVERLAALEDFKRITAPFDGTVTSRSTDVGALIVVGVPTATPLFTVSDDSKLRIYVHVPQNASAAVKPGMAATFTVPEYPGKTYTATVMATSNAVDIQNGSLLVQLQADNSAHALKPGDYAQVHFAVVQNTAAVQVPASALMFRDGGMVVATVERDNRAVIKPVTVVSDFGTSVEIASGLTRHDRIIDNPPDSLRAGDTVHVANAAPAGSPAN